MAEADPKPLADVLFGVQDADSLGGDVELAEVLSAWFRASRAQVRDGASFGTRTAKEIEVPRPQP